MSTNSIRRKIGLFLLRKRNTTAKDKGLINYENSRKFGIIFEAKKGQDLNPVQSFINHLREDKKELYVLKYVPDRNKAYAKNSIFKTLLTKKDLNFFTIPKKKSITNYTRNNYDILINLLQTRDLTSHYISACCNARLKVAPYTEEFSHVYDLMIDVKEDTKLDEIIEIIDKYIRMINKNQ